MICALLPAKWRLDFLDKQNGTWEKKILEFTVTGLNDPPQQSGRASILKKVRDSVFTEAFQEDSASSKVRSFAKRCHQDQVSPGPSAREIYHTEISEW